MDTGLGNFVPFDDMEMAKQLKEKYPQHGGIFSIGEILEIKGSRFKVQSIKGTTMRLQLLKNG